MPQLFPPMYLNLMQPKYFITSYLNLNNNTANTSFLNGSCTNHIRSNRLSSI